MIKWSKLMSLNTKDYNKLCFPFLTCQRFSHTLWEDVVNVFAHSHKDNVILTSSHWHVCILANHPHTHSLTLYSSVIVNLVTSKRSIFKKKLHMEITCIWFMSFKITRNFMQGNGNFFSFHLERSAVSENSNLTIKPIVMGDWCHNYCGWLFYVTCKSGVVQRLHKVHRA